VPLPKPPIRSMTDFVVFAFVSIVTFILFSAVLGILLTTIISPDRDNSQTIGILADVTTSLISALVGFLAGKGTGHQEAAEEQRAREREARK
jgi:UPF0716 family protein affecting phage T7 exclusion